jgi:hypothetical protein
MTTLVSRTAATEAAEARWSAKSASANANARCQSDEDRRPPQLRAEPVGSSPQRDHREVGEGRQSEDDDEVRQRVGVVDAARVGQRVAGDAGSDREPEADPRRAPPSETPHEHDACGDQQDARRFARRGAHAERGNAEHEDEQRSQAAGNR